MKPTIEELVAAQAMLDKARDNVRAIANEYAIKNRVSVFIGVYDGRARVLLSMDGHYRVWCDGAGVRNLNQTYVDYDEKAIRDKLIEAEKMIEERRS